MNTSRKMAFGLLGISGFLFSIAALLEHGLVESLFAAGSFALIASAACFINSTKS